MIILSLSSYYIILDVTTRTGECSCSDCEAACSDYVAPTTTTSTTTTTPSPAEGIIDLEVGNEGEVLDGSDSTNYVPNPPVKVKSFAFLISTG